ncbi:hypothetical protein J5N97_008015 [Dioscorea zingiberensis]|uniref:TLC domain-containing protein n=1 Tax=Dioscorea zingiberensis TaxID=325984 RepID=A0A9D5HUU5_9LILI|nr:hypothetical protein J5N97_008015 [Dioscorea zingiberensis]
MGLMDVLPSVDWEAQSYPDYEDFLALPFLVVFFPTVRFLLDRFIFEKVARRLVLGKGHEKLDVETKERRKKLNKFKESAWKCVYFLSADFISLLKLKGAYMYSAGFYTYSIFALIFWETKRADWGVSMSHHVSTAFLIILSYVFRFARVGTVVLLLHDVCDVFLETGKMSKYSGCEPIAVVMFLLFVCAWVIFRLLIFPFWVIRSTSYEVVLTLDKENLKSEGPIYYYIFNSLLIFLLVLHIYWWFLMLRMLVKQIQSRGHIGDDVRSDSEGEEHED